MTQNKFILNMIAELDKIKSKIQINKDIKILETMISKIKFIGKIGITETKKLIGQQLKGRTFGTVKVNTEINTKDIKQKTKQATAQAQKVANSNKVKIPYSFEMDKEKLQNQLKNFAKENSRLFSSKEMTAKYNQLVDSASIAKSKQELNGLRKQLSAFRTELIATNKAGMTWGDKLKTSIAHFAQYFSGASVIYAVTNQIRNAWTEAKTLDDSLVNLQKVTAEIEDRDSLYKYFDKALNKAQKLNVKVGSLIDAITEFKKLGWSLENAELGGKWTNVLSNVGDVDIETAIGSIKTAVASFDKIGGYGNDQMDKKLEAYVDLINNMSNKYSIDAQGLAEAIRLSAGTLTEAHVSIEKAATMFATANKYYNDPSYLGNTAKIGSLRMRATSGDTDAIKELQEMGEEIDDLATASSTLREKLLALTGVDIMEDEHTFKSYYDQLYEIAQVIDTIDDTSRANVLETLFGKSRSAGGAAILSGMKESSEAYKDAINSAGSATQEYTTWMQSADAATQRFSNALTATYQNFINGNTVRDIANLGAEVLEFANAWGITEGAVKGFLALKIGTFLTNGFMAFATATKQVEQYGRALQMVNNIPNGNLSQKFSSLKGIATATASLTTAQLKQVLVSKTLTQQDRIRILQMQGMTKEMALQKLAEMNLTQATNAQTTANAAQTASTFSLKSALTGLKSTISGVFLSNQVGIALMAFSVGVSAVTSAVSNHNQKMEELRQKAKESAEEANTLGDEISNLASKYISLSEAVKTDESAKEDLMTTQTELLKKLGLEGESIDDLIAKYGSLSNVIRQVSLDSLKNSQIDLIAGVDATREELLDAGKDNFGSSDWKKSIVAMGKDAGKAWQALEDAGIVSSGVHTDRGGEWFLSGDDSVEGVLENFETIENALSALRDSDAFTAEELSDNPLYQELYERYSGMKDAVKSYQSSIADLNENLAQQTMLAELQGSEIPKTEEDFETFREELVKTAIASKQFIGNEEEITNAINNYLSTVPEFEGFYSIPLKNELDKVDALLNQEDFSKLSFTDAWNALDTSEDEKLKNLKSSLLELAETGKLTVEAFNETDDSDEFLKQIGLSAEEAIKKINTLVDTSVQLKSLSTNISTMSDLLTKKNDGNVISASELSGFDAEVRGLESWKEYERLLGDSTSSIEECQNATNALATEWLYSGNYLANLTDEYKQYYITQLEHMGIKNAELIVESALVQKKQEEALATEYASIATSYNSSEKGRNNKVTVDLTNATTEEINKLHEEGKVSIDTANALIKYVWQKKIANNTTISTAADIRNLAALAGASTKLGELLNKLADIKQGFANGMPSNVAEIQAKNLQKQIEALIGGGNDVNVPVEVTPQYSTSSSSGGSGSSSSNGSAQKDAKKQIDWLERKLTTLQKKIDETKTKFENLFTLKDKENNLSKQLKYTESLLTATNKAADKYLKYAKKIDLSKELKDKIKNGSYDISEYSSDTAEKIQQFETYYDKYKELKKQADELTSELRTIKADTYQLYVDDAEAKIEKSNAYLELDAGNYKEQNKHLKAQQKYLKKQYEYLIKIAELNKDDIEVSKLKAEYAKLVAENNKAQFQNIANTYDNKIGFTTSKLEAYQKQIELLEARGEQIGTALYKKQLTLNGFNEDKLEAEYKKLLSQLDTIVVNTDDWYDAQDTLFSIEESLVQIQIENENLQNSINQLKFDNFDNLINKLSDITDDTDFLIGLLDSDNLYDDAGQITADGLTAIGMAATAHNTSLAKSKEYQKMLDDLEKMYSVGEISQKEYEELKDTYMQGQREQINAWNDSKDAVIDYVKQGLDAQNEALAEAIDKKKELLDTEKELYDFQNKIKDQNKDIARLERQIAVLEGDDSEENRKKLRELKSQLEDARKEQQDTLYDKSIDDQKEALDKMLTDSQEKAEEYLKDSDKVFSDAISYINNNTEKVSANIQKIAKETGYNISTYITNAWSNSSNAVTTYYDTLSYASSGIVGQIELITNAWTLQANEAERAAQAIVKAQTANHKEQTAVGAEQYEKVGTDTKALAEWTNTAVGQLTPITTNRIVGDITSSLSRLPSLDLILPKLQQSTSNNRSIDIQINTNIEGVATNEIVKDFEKVARVQAEDVIAKINRGTFARGVRH